MFRLSIVILSIISCFACQANRQAVKDGVEIFFKVARHDIDRSFNGNGERLDAFTGKWSQMQHDGVTVDSITVEAYASPEGRSDFNATLAQNRMQAIANYLIDHVGVDADVIRPANSGIAWQRLYEMVEEDTTVPDRQQVLDIIANTPVWVYAADENRIVDGRKKQLMELSNGRTYRWLLENIFPKLRHSAAVAIYATAPDNTVHQPVSPLIWHIDVPLLETGETQAFAIRPPPARFLTSVKEQSIKRFAIKTNLIFDAALIPSLEFEWMINPKWSASLEGDCAWWDKAHYHKYYQLAMIQPECKYWFKSSSPWNGMYAGAFIGIGKYDLENGGTGYKGEGAMAGVTYGYSKTISDNFAIEAEIGLGLLYTRYNEYNPLDGHYVYQYTRSLFIGGPCKIKLAVAYRFYEVAKNKKGGPR